MGITRCLDVSPTVGLMPQIELSEAGEMIEPEVSEPSVPTAKPMEAATPDPELEPPGSAFGQ